jgi:predicted nuclease with RNAse H fold
VADPEGAALRVVGAVAGVCDARALPAPAPGVRRLCVTADPTRDVRPDLVRALVEAGIPVLEVHTQPLSLEDAFLTLVGRRPLPPA